MLPLATSTIGLRRIRTVGRPFDHSIGGHRHRLGDHRVMRRVGRR
jgi:hypothetical protein